MNPATVLLHTLWLTTLIEAATLACRFGGGWRSPEVTASTIGRLTRGWRVHHGYLALPMCVLAWPVAAVSPLAAGWLMAGGLAMGLSDALHHFVFLRWLTGHHEWDWRYAPVLATSEDGVENT